MSLLFYLLRRKYFSNVLYKFIDFFFSLSIAMDENNRQNFGPIKRSFLSRFNNFIPYKIVKINQAFSCFSSCFFIYIFFSFILLCLSIIWSIESFFDSLLFFFGFLFISSILVSFFIFRLVLAFSSFFALGFFSSFFGGFISARFFSSFFGGFFSALTFTFLFVFFSFICF